MEGSGPPSAVAHAGTGRPGAWRRALAADLPVDPLAIAGALGAIAVFAAVLVADGVLIWTVEWLTALALVLFVVGLVARGASNGVAFLFLVTPLFNAEDYRPYFVLLLFFLLLVVGRGVVGHLAAGRPLRVPGWPFLALFCAAAVLALPLDGRALWLEVQLSPWQDIFWLVVGGELWTRFYYAHVVLSILAGAALYVVVANQDWPRERVARLSVAVASMLVAVVVVGLWLYDTSPWPQATFLTVWLGGKLTGGFTGLGFNVSYFAQYATAHLPLAGLALVERAPTWTRTLAFVALVLGSFAILLTVQTGAFLVLGVVFVLLLAVARRLRGSPAADWPMLTAALAVTLWAGVVVLWFSPAGPRLATRFVSKWIQGDPVRTHLLSVTWRIFREEPLLGIGSGRFYDLFRFFSTRPRMQFGTWSTHYLYAQFLVEQGLLGLLGFCGLLAVTLSLPARAVWRRSASPAAALLLVSLTGWVVYGLLQYTFLLRAMQCYFWIALGLLVGLTERPPSRWRPSGRWWLAAGLAAVALLGVRLHTLGQWPIVPSWGLHASSGDHRWTGGAAWFTVPVEGRVLRLTFSGPDPRSTGRPQEVRLRLDGTTVARLRLDNVGWRTLDVPVDRPPGAVVRVEIGVAYSFVPAALGLSADPRRLGVALQPVQWLNP